MHKYGGVYARTEPLATIGIFYGHLQAVQRRVLTGENPSAEELLRGSHEGKVAEALFLCHAAGWPARIITYQELLRGPLPSSMKVILLVGLDQTDNSWSWGAGLEPTLRKFLDRGGRILTDDESVCPVPSTKTGMKVAAYVTQSNLDPTPQLFARNAENISKLCSAMQDVPAPLAASESQTVWAIPTTCVDTQYVTVVNQASAEGDEANQRLQPADPKATKPEPWKFKGQRQPVREAANRHAEVDHRPPDLRPAPRAQAHGGGSRAGRPDPGQLPLLRPATGRSHQAGDHRGKRRLGLLRSARDHARRDAHGRRAGATGPSPVRADTATVYAITETTTRLPLRETDDGDYTVTVTELLTGLSETAKVTNHATATVTPRAQVQVREQAVVTKFATRKESAADHRPHPRAGGRQDPRRAGAGPQGLLPEERTASSPSVRVKPGGVVESLQPLRSPNRYPQWKTATTDLVLFGTPANNILLLDQASRRNPPAQLHAAGPDRSRAALHALPFRRRMRRPRHHRHG